MCCHIEVVHHGYDSTTKHNAHLTLFTHYVIWPGTIWNPLYLSVFMQSVLQGDRRFWILQLEYLKEELARTYREKLTLQDRSSQYDAEAYSAHADTHTVYKRNTVYESYYTFFDERSIRITTDILLLRITTTATTIATIATTTATTIATIATTTATTTTVTSGYCDFIPV